MRRFLQLALMALAAASAAASSFCNPESPELTADTFDELIAGGDEKPRNSREGHSVLVLCM